MKKIISLSIKVLILLFAVKVSAQLKYKVQIPFSAVFQLEEDQQNKERWDEKNSLYTFGGEGWNFKF